MLLHQKALDMVKIWLGIPSIHTHEWEGDTSLRDWWKMMVCNAMENRKAMSSITILDTWKMWKHRNTRFFNKTSAPQYILLQIIKDNTKLWIVVSAKYLTLVMT
jgi:hypothetical protein